MARTINVEINGQFVRKDNKNAGVMGEGNVTTMSITFDETWRGFGKCIIWRNANGENPVSVILFDGKAGEKAEEPTPLAYTTTIPREPLEIPGWCSFSIEGYKEEDEVHKVSLSVADTLMVAQSDSYHKPAEPTPSQTQQILEEMGKTEERVKASATQSKSWAVGGTGTRDGEDTDNSKYYAKTAEESAKEADDSKNLAETSAMKASKSASNAEQAAHCVSHMARLAESWAVGGTGTRPGEDTDNAKYWSALAQVAASGEKIVYVDAFGAEGDGVTDDTAAIQKAINFVQDNNLRVLAFTPGRSYKITSRLSITKAMCVYGNNAKLLSYVESRQFLTVCGSLGNELTLAADVSAQSGDKSVITIQTQQPHRFAVGDRLILQSQRDALAEDSGLFWCGVPTGAAKTCQYAEVLEVNKVENDTTFSCVGSLIYPFYYANREDGVDISTHPTQREHSTVRKANFLTGVEIQDLEIETYGTGDISYDNTMVLFLCADSVVRNVRLTKYGGHGRGMAMQNCLNTGWINCAIDSKHTYNDYQEVHAVDNHFSFASCWYCYADGCASYHAAQTFDATYALVLEVEQESDMVRCPTLYPAVRGCLVHGSIDSAATNHSGSYGCTYENSRFVNFARPLSVRSPHTLIHGCQFSCKSSRGASGEPAYAIMISDVTTFGTRVENCVISSDFGIGIRPYVTTLSAPPSIKEKGIQIVNNTFFSVQRRAIYIESALDKWNYEGGKTDGAYTDFAVARSGVFIFGNLFYRCGSGTSTFITINNLTNGVSLCGNRFIACASYKDSEVIAVGARNTDIHICDNLFSGCSGKAGYTYSPYLSKSDPRCAQLDPNYVSRNVYRGNVSCDNNFQVCDYTGITHVYAPNVERVSGSVCGTLFSNGDSAVPEDLGWIGDFESKSISPVVEGNKVYTITTATLSPADDNLKDLGSAEHRWKDIYCATSTINTSDKNQKTDLADLPEQVLEAWGKVRWKIFRFKQAVEEKGDGARLHVGLVAQDIQQAFADAGLDAASYGLFCVDEIEMEDGTKKNLYGIRYTEALALECAWLRRQLERTK